jgi:hypothetical protein
MHVVQLTGYSIQYYRGEAFPFGAQRQTSASAIYLQQERGVLTPTQDQQYYSAPHPLYWQRCGFCGSLM